MNRNPGVRTLCALLATTLLSCLAARGQFPHPPQLFTGLINDYTPSSVAGGPYVMAGKWTLEIRHAPGGAEVADFSAYMNMETSDYGIMEGIVAPTDATTRGAHTHDITMTNVSVTYDSPACPANPAGTPPAAGGNIMITGNVSVTGNGTPAGFESKGPSTLQVCLTGGSQVPLSNLTMTFLGPATGHFGTQPIHGVVRK